MALAALAMVAAVVVAFTGGGEDFRFATAEHRNEAGGYAFRHPPAWDVEDQGTTSSVRSPEQDVAVVFGVGAPGGLDRAGGRFLQEIQARYRNVRLLGLQIASVGGLPAVSVSGAGTNAEGVRLRFLAITAAGPERNYSIGVFTAARSDPERVVPPTQEILNSFRVEPGD